MNFLNQFFNTIAPGDNFTSRGRTVTETDFVQWCSLTGDWYVLHTNAHYAAGTRFGQRVAPGLLIQAYAAGLGVPPHSPAIIANYGSDRLRFVAPVFIGDTIHLRAKVLEKTVKRPNKDGVLKIEWNVHNQDGTLVMASDLQILMAWSGGVN